MLKFHLTELSSNKKTGPIPVSTSSNQLCPATCTLRDVCYAKSGPLAIHWRKVSSGERGVNWPEFLDLIRQLPHGQFWRHNQAGDLQDPNTSQGIKALKELTEANGGLKGYTYSHHKLKPNAVQAFKTATAQGFTVNASTETETAADSAVAHGLRTVLVVTAEAAKSGWHWLTAGGNKVIVCPADRFQGMNCNKCRLCQSRPQNIIIAFIAHGSSKAKVEQLLTGG
jgi:hypothetical protein